MAKVLVVDDSSTVRNDVSGYLMAQGINVSTAIDGADGLAKALGDPELKLVLCDVHMPTMDGLTMIEKLRASGNQVAVIMLTTEDDTAMKQRGKSAGVKGWIVKPFDGATAMNGIKRLLE